jgi:hypothetical protein
MTQIPEAAVTTYGSWGRFISAVDTCPPVREWSEWHPATIAARVSDNAGFAK